MQIIKNIDLSPLNTFALNHRAEAFAKIKDHQQLLYAINTAKQNQWPLNVIGGGSNIILTGDIKGLVIQPNFKFIEVLQEDQTHIEIVVGAGVPWDQLVQICVSRGWYGLENLSLIPGLTGAAPIQNIGAYGVECSQFITRVNATFLKNGEQYSLNSEECDFGYRESRFKNPEHPASLITSIHLKLNKQFTAQTEYPVLQQAHNEQANPFTALQLRELICQIRQSKLPDPKQLPNVGSFFKNPIISNHQFDTLQQTHPGIVGYPQCRNSTKIAAGWLIDQCQWKGKRLGPVGMHKKQALVMVNYSQAKSQNVLELADRICADVEQQFEITLEIEPRFI